jgi:hypothetical protein
MAMIRSIMIRDTFVKSDGNADLVSDADRLLTFFMQGAGT